MGALLSKKFRKSQIPILIVGLDSAGKTTILHKLKFNEVYSKVPTIGFNVETLKYRNITFTLWDIGGQMKLRQLWYYYYKNTCAIIFVVDSSDHDRIQEAADELHSLLANNELRDSILLVIANKQDLPNAMSVTELTMKLQLNEIKNRRWYVQKACAIQGKGLYDALYWIRNELSNSMLTLRSSNSKLSQTNGIFNNPFAKKISF